MFKIFFKYYKRYTFSCQYRVKKAVNRLRIYYYSRHAKALKSSEQWMKGRYFN